MSNRDDTQALIFDIKRDCSEDGPGIRTTVFFKGCPLSCIWCQNPEGKNEKIQITYKKDLCNPQICNDTVQLDKNYSNIKTVTSKIKDGNNGITETACIHICEDDCLHLSPKDKLHIDHIKCTGCNKCIDVCPTGALEQIGYWISQEELLYRIRIDKPFFQSTGGGVTLSGGEVTQQMNFAGKFLEELKKEDIHTAIETSGFFNYEKFSKKMLPFIDIIYFDLKLIDDQESRKYTGQSNALIIDNFKRLINETNVIVVPRIPLIPDITTQTANLRGIADLLKSLPVTSATLLPYNPLWQDKVEKLDMKTRYNRVTLMSEKEKNDCLINFYEKHS